MHVWKYKPGILDPPDVEEEDRKILDNLRHGGTLFGDRIGEIEGFVPAEKPYRHVPEPESELEQKQRDRFLELYQENRRQQEQEEQQKVQYPILMRCSNCNRSVPTYRSDTCSQKCQETIDRYREEMLIWMGMK